VAGIIHEGAILDPSEALRVLPNPAKAVLSSDTVLLHMGLLAINGRLSLTARRLVFETTSAVHQLVMDDMVEIPTGLIRSAEEVGYDRIVVIHTRNDRYRFSGDGAHRVLRRLAPLVGSQVCSLREMPPFGPTERVRLHGAVRMDGPGVEDVQGELYLTDERIWFDYPAGHEKKHPHGPFSLDIRVERVRDHRLVGFRGRHRRMELELGPEPGSTEEAILGAAGLLEENNDELDLPSDLPPVFGPEDPTEISPAAQAFGAQDNTEIAGPTGVYLLDGALAVVLYTLLFALRDSRMELRSEEPPPELQEFRQPTDLAAYWEGWYRDGSFPMPGLIVVGLRRLHFVPIGVMARRKTAREIEIPLQNILRVHGEGRIDPVLRIDTQDGRSTRFSFSNFDKHFQEFREFYDAAWLRLGAEPPIDPADLIGQWDAVRPPEIAPYGMPELKSLAVERRGRLGLCLGGLILTRTHLYFFPVHAPADGEIPGVYPLNDVIRRWDSKERDWIEDRILIEHRAASLAFLPIAGAAWTIELWGSCRTPARILRAATMDRVTLRRLVSNPKQVRLRFRSDTEHLLRNAQCFLLRDGVGIPLARVALDRAPGKGGRVIVEIAHPEGVCSLETEVLRHNIPGEEGSDPGPHMLVVTVPPDIRIYNQRGARRTPVDLSVRATVLDDEQELPPESMITLEAQTMTLASGSDDELRPGAEASCRVFNISTLGCALRSNQRIANGSRLLLTIQLPELLARVEVRVVREIQTQFNDSRHRYGAHFIKIEEAAERAIANLVLQSQRDELAGLALL